MLILNLGKIVDEISSHLFAVNDIDWSRHYNYLASASDDTLAMIHDLNIQSASATDDHEGFQDIYQKELDKNMNLDKSLVRVFKGHTHHVTGIKFDQGTSIVLTGSIDKTAMLWDVRSAHCIHKIEDHAIEIYGVDISPDSNLILTAGRDGYVRLWEIRTGVCLKTIKIDFTARVGHWFFTPDAKALVANNVDQCISAYDIETSKLISRFEGHKISNGYYLKHCMHYYNDEVYLLSGSEDGCIYGWNVDTEELVLRQNVIDTSNQLSYFKRNESFADQVEIQVPGENISSNAIIWCVDSSESKGLIAWVDS